MNDKAFRFIKKNPFFLMIKSHAWGDDCDNIKYDTWIMINLFKKSNCKMNQNLNIFNHVTF